MKIIPIAAGFAGVLSIISLASSCNHKSVRADADAPATDLTHSSEIQKSTDVEIAYFDYDSAELTSAAQGTLKHDAEILRERPNAVIQLEGYCDPRGTQAYNHRLGMRRARAARIFLLTQGFNAGQMRVVSYGKDRLVDTATSEEAYARNRRVVLNVQSSTLSSLP